MNPAAILALISDLYAQVTALQRENEALRQAQENAALREQLAAQPDQPADTQESTR